MKKIAYLMVGVCLLALSACGGSGPSGELVTTGDDLVGVWKRATEWKSGGWVVGYMQCEADGTMDLGRAPDKWDYAVCSYAVAFEGTQVSVTETDCPGFQCTGRGEPAAVYQVQLLANGNLRFVVVEDGCPVRRNMLTLEEWEPVG